MTIVGVLVLMSLLLLGSASGNPPQNKQECAEHCKKEGGYVNSPPYTVPILKGKFSIEDGNPHCMCSINDGLGFVIQSKGLDVNDFKRSMYDGLKGVRKWLNKHKKKGGYTMQ